MLTLVVPKREWYNNNTGEFVYTKGATLQLEHSLISLSEWEAKWKKPFLRDKKDAALSDEELIDYIRCMCINEHNVPEGIWKELTQLEINKIVEYIDDPQTATWFSEDKNPNQPTRSEVITSELIYYWMIAQNIPFECRKWHLNRLLTLIRVCSIKNAPPKKMGKKDSARQRRELNAYRQKKFNTTG